MQDLKSEITKTWNNCNKNFLYFLRYKMCFAYKQIHTFYIYSRVSFQAWLPLYSTICSPDRRCRHPADSKLHHTYTVYIEARPRGTCPSPFPRFHGPTPLIFFTMSAMRSVAHTSLAEITKSLTRRRAWALLSNSGAVCRTTDEVQAQCYCAKGLELRAV